MRDLAAAGLANNTVCLAADWIGVEDKRRGEGAHAPLLIKIAKNIFGAIV